MASFSFALPTLARCERPSGASWRFCRDQPGRLAQGPEEKFALTGRAPGAVTLICHPFRWAPLVGERCPADGDTLRQRFGQACSCRGVARAIRSIDHVAEADPY